MTRQVLSDLESAFHDSTITNRMILVPGGTFRMGSDNGSDFETPVHTINLDSFYLDRNLVTNSQFAEFVQDTDYVTTCERNGTAWGFDGIEYRDIEGLSWRTHALVERMEHPVTFVSWHDAEAFAKWAGKRLPTEAEWEKAALGGLEQAAYPWGDKEPDQQLAGFGREASIHPGTSPVGSFPANGYGLNDMTGNVWQWCSDFYQPDYYAKSAQHNPTGPWTGKLKTRRGGAWNVLQAFRLRCSNRGAVQPDMATSNMGFRCALTTQPAE